MRRRPATHRTTNARCAPPRQSQACSRTSPTTASPARATPGRSSSRGRTPRERWCLRVTGAGMDAGGFAQPAGRRPAMTKPIPRRNFHRGAGRTAGGSERRPSDEGRAAGGGDAATTPQAAHQLKELLKTSRMDAATPRNPSNDQRALRTPPTIPSVFANLPDNSKPRPRNPRQVKLPRQEAAGALVFARDASRHGCRRIRAARGRGGPL